MCIYLCMLCVCVCAEVCRKVFPCDPLCFIRPWVNIHIAAWRFPVWAIHSSSMKDDRILRCPYVCICNKSSCIQCICWTLFFNNQVPPMELGVSNRGSIAQNAPGFLLSGSFTVFLVVHEWATPGPTKWKMKCGLLWLGLYETERADLCRVNWNTCSCKGPGRCVTVEVCHDLALQVQLRSVLLVSRDQPRPLKPTWAEQPHIFKNSQLLVWRCLK